ncbi:hypothetical protein TEA_017903 [Camellia sinensis var. sinensis]|uniref:Uncharacterized protein n=1 Tax=Camellia sinensis var. sinensis TaxID=542762 RepID=A0A4S4E080_CAMSN|nr:hypothetical protein TEA_017903 [Camellia sinensis var. sinensis]
MIQLSPTMPAIHASKLVWACIRDLATNKAVFEMVSRNKKSVKVANWLICNSAFELSFTVFDYNKFQELALGIELTNRPFLWVVRPDLNHDHGKDLNHDHAFPNGFRDRVGNRGQIIGTESPICSLLLEPLWMELHHRRSEQWSSFPLLALLC